MTSRTQNRPSSDLLVILLLGCLTAFGPLSIDMYLPALPDIAESFGVKLASVQLSLTSFFVGLALGQMFYGPISDRFGRKRPVYFGLTVYLLASVGCALASSSEMLVLMRFLQALGSCSGMVASRAVVRDLFDEKDSARVFSMLMLVMGVAPILAPLLGGYLNLAFGWQFIFWLLALLSGVCLTVLFFFLPETKKADPNVQLTRSIHTFSQILKNPSFVRFALAGGAAQAGMFAYITGSPFVFIELFGVAPKSYGWIFGLNALGLIAASQVNVRLLRVNTPEKILKVSFAILLAAGLGLVTASLMGAGVWPVGLLLFVYVGFLGLTFPNTTALALSSEGHRAGSASALMGTLQFTLAALASAAVSLLHTGTSLAMAAVIASCAVIAFVLANFKVTKSKIDDDIDGPT